MAQQKNDDWFGLRLPKPVHERLRKIAELENRSMSQQLRRYLNEGLARDEKTYGLTATEH